MATVTPSSRITGVIHVELTTFGDERGSFTETYRREWVPGAREMIQSNRGDRKAGCVVGLHYHLHQADYWYVPFGRARAVLHDLRVGSPTDGATEVIDLGETADADAADGPGAGVQRGLYIPPGVAHGFASLTDMTITYLVDGYYNPSDELGVAWNDPEIGADWGLTDPVVSGRDAVNPPRSALAPHAVPRWRLRT